MAINNKVQKHITITEEQAEFVSGTSMNLSRFVQRKLNEEMRRIIFEGKFEVEDFEEEV